MRNIEDVRIWVCESDSLKDGDYVRVDCRYRNEISSVLVIRYKGLLLAYRNLCVHMPRELDCEKHSIFDQAGRWLRCSMHGIVYDPVDGASVSTMCHGEKLTPVKVVKDGNGVWIQDKRVKAI